MFCNKPDRDVPQIECGYPLPCPYHTNVIDTTFTLPAVDLKTDDLAEVTAILALANAMDDTEET